MAAVENPKYNAAERFVQIALELYGSEREFDIVPPDDSMQAAVVAAFLEKGCQVRQDRMGSRMIVTVPKGLAFPAEKARNSHDEIDTLRARMRRV